MKVTVKALLTTTLIWVTFILMNQLSIKVEANEIKCPVTMTSHQCYLYLLEQKSKIEQEGRAVQNKLSDEQYQQLSLLEKINYLDAQVASAEAEIRRLELEIETKNVEIKILNEEIDVVKNTISTVSQEIERLQGSVDTRISLSYKYSFVTPVEIFLETKNFDTLLRRIKYVSETRKKDKDLLSEMFSKSNILKEEERILGEKQEEILLKRKQIEDEKSEVFTLKQDLTSQKNERTALYAESKRRETVLAAEAQRNRDAIRALESAIAAYAAASEGEMVNYGPVGAGAYIGDMGSTGCATAAHLHFTIEFSYQVLGYASINPWGGYLNRSGNIITAGSMKVPLAGTAYLTQDRHKGWSGGQGNAIDMSTGIPGSPVIAARGGTLYKGTEQICGGKYAKIVHGDIQTVYLHLR